MIRYSFVISEKIRENKAELNCAVAVAQTLYMALFKLVAQVVDNLLKRFYFVGKRVIVVYKRCIACGENVIFLCCISFATS